MLILRGGPRRNIDETNESFILHPLSFIFHLNKPAYKGTQKK